MAEGVCVSRSQGRFHATVLAGLFLSGCVAAPPPPAPPPSPPPSPKPAEMETLTIIVVLPVTPGPKPTPKSRETTDVSANVMGTIQLHEQNLLPDTRIPPLKQAPLSLPGQGGSLHSQAVKPPEAIREYQIARNMLAASAAVYVRGRYSTIIRRQEYTIEIPLARSAYDQIPKSRTGCPPLVASSCIYLPLALRKEDRISDDMELQLSAGADQAVSLSEQEYLQTLAIGQTAGGSPSKAKPGL